MAGLEEHRLKLNIFCRLCPNRVTKICIKNNFLDEIKQVYNIDTLCEDDDIYPQNICSACRLRLTRFRKSGDGSISFCVVPEFVSHSSEFCKICDFKSGRPQKQRKRKLSVIVSDLNSDTDSAPESSLNESSCAENLNDSSCLDNLNDSCHASDTENFLAASSSFDNSLADNSEVDNLTLKGLSLDTLDNSCNFGDVVIDSLSVERFIDTQIAKAFICTICRGVPFEPVVSCCNHIFCSNCIKVWLSVSSHALYVEIVLMKLI